VGLTPFFYFAAAALQTIANISLHDLHTLDIGSNAAYCGKLQKK
jgi:hypothetical protein